MIEWIILLPNHQHGPQKNFTDPVMALSRLWDVHLQSNRWRTWKDVTDTGAAHQSKIILHCYSEFGNKNQWNMHRLNSSSGDYAFRDG